jgi:hypothetical protein
MEKRNRIQGLLRLATGCARDGLWSKEFDCGVGFANTRSCWDRSRGSPRLEAVRGRRYREKAIPHDPEDLREPAGERPPGREGVLRDARLRFNPQFTDDTAACVVISDDIYAMLVTHAKN